MNGLEDLGFGFGFKRLVERCWSVFGLRSFWVWVLVLVSWIAGDFIWV